MSRSFQPQVAETAGNTSNVTMLYMRFLLLLLVAVPCFSADFDILIRNARVVDGTGNPWYRADVGVKNGKIEAIGRLSNASADRTIDGAGRVVAPGFIDVHTHIEGGIEKVPRGDNYILDGVTTLITGNCGGSRLPLGDWFSKLEAMGIGPNVGSLIGHNTVRAEVMGTANRKATPEEIVRMQELVEKAMLDGAVGFSTGLIYIPGTYSDTAEVVALGKAAAKYGGTYASHMRDEGPKVMEAITEAVTVGKEAGMQVQLSHFKIDTKRIWGSSTKTLDLVEQFRREGVDVVVDQYPYDHSSTNLGITMPSWALADGREKILERLKDPETRRKIAIEMKAMLEDKGQPNYEYAIVANYKPEPSYEGKNISEINVLKGRPRTVDAEIETILDMIAEGGAQMVYHSMGNEDVERILRYPNTAIASDGGVREFGEGMPHPRSYGTNARVLAEFVRNRKVLTLEDAIRRMTSLPARTFGLKNRGMVREGFAADLVIFDPAKVQDKSTYQQPHQYTEGFDFVVVNGKLLVDNSKLTDARPGQVLRRNVALTTAAR
ncbi:MAG TPA: D-aminoacylase [Bryobacteraceae bacterium]|nr:D-aminoacylase [Bryobacteraceae bacterium]